MNLTWISKNPVSKLHTACSCLPSWLVCDHFITKDAKRTRWRRDGITEFGIIASGNRLGFHFLVVVFFSCVERSSYHTPKLHMGKSEGSELREMALFFSVVALFCDLGFYSRRKYKVDLLESAASCAASVSFYVLPWTDSTFNVYSPIRDTYRVYLYICKSDLDINPFTFSSFIYKVTPFATSNISY